jgi:nitrous oxidase accessory protein NosD
MFSLQRFAMVLTLIAAPSALLARVTSVSPGESIGNAITTAGPGDVISIKSGVYHETLHIEHSGAIDQPITIRAEKTGAVILDGGGISGAGTHIRVEGLTVRGVRNGLQNENAAVRTNSNWVLYQVTVEECSGSGIGVFGEDVAVLECVSRNNGQNGIGGAKCQRVLVSGCEISNNNRGFDNPPWKTDGNARQLKGKWVTDAAWEGGGGKWSYTDGVAIRNCRYHDNGGPGIWFDAENRNFVIKDCEVFGEVGTVDDWEGMGISVEINHGPAWLLHNYVHDNAGANIAIQESNDTKIEQNYIVNGGLELRAMPNRGSQLNFVRIKGNFFSNAGVYTSVGSWSFKSPELRHISVDENTYDNPPGKFMNWAGEELADLATAQKRLSFEAAGKLGKFEIPAFTTTTQPATTESK